MDIEDVHFPTSCIGILADLWAKDGVNQKDLGSSLIKNKSSINKMLASLEDHQMIKKVNDPNDKRSKLIFLTEKGRKMQGIIEEASMNCDLRILEHISKEDLAITKKTLGKYYEILLAQALQPEE